MANTVSYSCGVCDPANEMDFSAMVTHIKEHHGEDVEGTQVSIEMVAHLDGDDFHSTTNRVTSPGGNVFFQHVVCER